jgi:hypothetical protein
MFEILVQRKIFRPRPSDAVRTGRRPRALAVLLAGVLVAGTILAMCLPARGSARAQGGVAGVQQRLLEQGRSS